MDKKKILQYGLLLVGMISVIPFLIATNNALFARDDFMFVYWIEEDWNSTLLQTAFSMMKTRWFIRDGRWAVYLYEVLFHPWYWGGEKAMHLLLSILLLLSVVGLYFFSCTFSEYLGTEKFYSSVFFILFLCPCIFFEEYYQVYLWVDGSIYQISTMLFEWGMGLLFIAINRKRKIYYILAGIILIIAGGTQPNFIGVICMGPILLQIVEIYKNRRLDKKLLGVSVATIISSLITLMAPGNYVRGGFEEREAGTLVSAIVVSAEYMFKRLWHLFSATFLIFFLMIALICGIKQQKKIQGRFILVYVGVYFLLVYATILPYVYGYNIKFAESFQNRCIYLIDVTITIGAVIVFFFLGSAIKKNEIVVLTIATYAMIFDCLLVGPSVSQTIPLKIMKNYISGTAQEYRDAWKEVYRICDESKGDVVIDINIPKRVEGCTEVLFSEDENYDDNKYLAYAYGLDSVSIIGQEVK